LNVQFSRGTKVGSRVREEEKRCYPNLSTLKKTREFAYWWKMILLPDDLVQTVVTDLLTMAPLSGGCGFWYSRIS